MKITVTEEEWITHSLRKLEKDGAALILKWEHDFEKKTIEITYKFL